MKKYVLAMAAWLLVGLAIAQTDTTGREKPDTLRIGNMTIIRKRGNDNDSAWKKFQVWDRKHNRKRKVETSYLIMDFGFSNFIDKTNYASAEARNYAQATRPGEAAFGESDFNLKNGKSTNFSLWFFMQRLHLIKRVVNLKYGLGIETNNYRFENNISFKKGGGFNGPSGPYVFRDSISFSKNKLALDYVTVPFMVNINTDPSKENPLAFSFGVSAGYLYASRNKQKSDERGKQKNRGNYDAEKFKLSFIGEVGLGPVKLYGTYAPRSVFERGLDLRPFNLGIRIGGWD
jgi:hypothetical protein